MIVSVVTLKGGGSNSALSNGQMRGGDTGGKHYQQLFYHLLLRCYSFVVKKKRGGSELVAVKATRSLMMTSVRGAQTMNHEPCNAKSEKDAEKEQHSHATSWSHGYLAPQCLGRGIGIGITPMRCDASVYHRMAGFHCGGPHFAFRNRRRRGLGR